MRERERGGGEKERERERENRQTDRMKAANENYAGGRG